jgi:hypothetical protein
MSMRRQLTVGLAVAAVFLLGAQAASAATEVGDNCLATEALGGAGFTFLPIARAPVTGLSLTVPSAGVVTQWKVSSTVPGAATERMVVLRATGKANEYTAIARSSEQLVAAGTNAFDTRISVAAGDRIGEASSGLTNSKAFLCHPTTAQDKMAFLNSSAAIGSPQTYVEIAEYRVPISAVVEPDVDGDGYGDETQDKCPQSAAFQSACPVVSLESLPVAKKGSVTLLLTTSLPAPVTVSGTVKLGKGKPATLSGGTQTVAPGAIASFTLKFSKKLQAALGALSHGKSLTLNIAATAANLSGPATTVASQVKLKGQAKTKSSRPAAPHGHR